MGNLAFFRRSPRPRVSCSLEAAVKFYLSLRPAQTARSYRGIINEFLSYCAARRLEPERLSVRDTAAWASWALEQPGGRVRGCRHGSRCTRATILRKAIVLRRFYSQLADFSGDAALFDHVIDSLRGAETGEKRPTNAANADQVNALFNIPSPSSRDGVRDKAFLALLFGGGLRISEAINLWLSDVSECEAGCVLTLRCTKSRHAQEQVLPEWAGGMVRAQQARRVGDGAGPDDWLLLHNSHCGNKPWNSRAAYAHFKALCVQAGISGLSPHSGRATAITQLLSQGEDYNRVRQFARHSSLNQVVKYDKRRRLRSDHPGTKLTYK